MNDIEWVPEEDWTKVKIGDLVRFARDEAGCTARATYVGQYGTVITCHDLSIYKSGGWSLFVQAPPAIVLPTEPGSYMSATGDLWTLKSDGWYAGRKLERYAPYYAPFTRLEPVPETAKKVLDRVRSLFPPQASFVADLDRIMNEFEVNIAADK